MLWYKSVNYGFRGWNFDQFEGHLRLLPLQFAHRDFEAFRLCFALDQEVSVCVHLNLPHLSTTLCIRYSAQFKNNYFTEMCSGYEEGSYLRLKDFCITQL